MPNLKKSKSRGYLTPDEKENPKIIKVAHELGWKVTKVSADFVGATDAAIATKYGRGRSVLLTYDKTAYTFYKPGEGFVGFIEHPTPKKESIDVFCLNLKNILSDFTSKDIAGYRIVIDNNAQSFEKIPIAAKQKRKKQKSAKKNK